MKQVFTIIVFIFIAIAGFGCSGNSSNSANSGDANAESPFAGITDANVALAEGNRLLDENQTEMAIEAFRQAVKLNPDLAEAHFQLGIAYSLLERQMEQSGEMTEPSDGKTKPNSQKAFERAVVAYKKWLEANPTDDVAWFNLGRTYAKLNKDDEAEKAFRQAVKLKPNDTEYQTELGAVLIKLAKYHEAIDPLKKAIELDDQNVRAQDLLEDAEAGRQRLDYVAPKNTNANTANSNSAANSNANMSANLNSNTAQKPPASTKPKSEEPKEKKPNNPANKPH
jgi:tetratricopeptide (TPR) repeat protein